MRALADICEVACVCLAPPAAAKAAACAKLPPSASVDDDDDDDDIDDATGKSGAARASELSNCASERVAGAANTAFSVPCESNAAARECCG